MARLITAAITLKNGPKVPQLTKLLITRGWYADLLPENTPSFLRLEVSEQIKSILELERKKRSVSENDPLAMRTIKKVQPRRHHL